MQREKANANWRHVSASYRKLIFGIGEKTGDRAGLSREAVAKAWRQDGGLSLAQLLRCRIRYFSDGLVIGSKGFVEQYFRSHRNLFSTRRKNGARKLTGGDWGELRTARALGGKPVAPPGERN